MPIFETDSPQCDGRAMELRRPTVAEGLQNKKDKLERDLADVNSALEALQANPEVSRCLDLVSKAIRL